MPPRGAGMSVIEVNGRRHDLQVDPDMPLLWALRDVLGLTGTKYGCGRGLCGACTVHVDGSPTRSCVTPVGLVSGRAITTIEGLRSPVGRAVQEAWVRLDVVQCGYCQPGQIMSAVGLLQENRDPDDEAINAAMAGNLCRCATYVRIRAAIKAAARALG